MDMDHLIGQRFNLISRSEIRYLGTLHEINPEQSTIALEEVYSFGTEGRPAKDFIPGSNQRFDYIVFRGSDVKDIKIAEEQKENRVPESSVPNDPAILNSSRPGPPSPVGPSRKQPPYLPPNFQPQQQPQHPSQFQNYYSPYDRAYGPPPGSMPPGPGFPGMPYGAPPPPGYFGPSGQPFPPNHGPFPPPPPLPPSQMPLAPQGQRPPSGPPQQVRPTSQAPKELPVNDRAQAAAGNRIPTPLSTVSPGPGPTPPNESKPSVSEALGPVSKGPGTVNTTFNAKTPLPAGSRSQRVVPALPMMVNNKSSAPLMPPSVNGALGTMPANAIQPSSTNAATAAATVPPTQIAMEEANRLARAAVANAMAKMGTSAQTMTNQPRPVTGGNAVDTLTQKVGEMRASDGPRGGARGGPRGQRGNFRGGPRPGRKVEIPSSDYDFESANAKFNKEDMIKEAIASGSPVAEPHEDGYANGGLNSAMNGENSKESMSPSAEAYNKSSSFFDNISSEAKDREDGSSQQMGRGGRGEEIRKNLETFGQGSVDGGFRGRGRGGGRGRGRPYGGQRGFGYGRGGTFRGRGRGGSAPAPAQV